MGTPRRPRPLAEALPPGGGRAPRGGAEAPARAPPAARRADRRPGHRAAASACCSRAGTRAARAARSSASSPRSTRATCASCSSRRRPTTRSATTGCWRFWDALPGWGGMAVLDRSWYGRVLVERVEKFATKRAVGARLRRDQRLRAHARRRGDDAVKFFIHVSERGATQALRGAPRRSAEVVEADRRGLAQPQEAQAVQGGDRGHARAHRHRPGAVVPGRGRLEELGAREGDRDGLERIEARIGA